MKYAGYVTATIVLLVYSSLMTGWALVKLWAWFIVPTFGLAPLTMPQAIGLSIVVGYMAKHSEGNNDQPFGMTLLKCYLRVTFMAPAALLVGFVVNFWM